MGIFSRTDNVKARQEALVAKTDKKAFSSKSQPARASASAPVPAPLPAPAPAPAVLPAAAAPGPSAAAPGPGKVTTQPGVVKAPPKQKISGHALAMRAAIAVGGIRTATAPASALAPAPVRATNQGAAKWDRPGFRAKMAAIKKAQAAAAATTKP